MREEEIYFKKFGRYPNVYNEKEKLILDSIKIGIEFSSLPTQSPSLTDEQINTMGEQEVDKVFGIGNRGDFMDCTDFFVRGFKMCLSLVKEGEKDSEDWISIKEQKPKRHDRVLIYGEDVALMCFGVAFFDGSKFHYDTSFMSMNDAENHSEKALKNVTHWKPIEPPKKIEQENLNPQEQQNTGNNG